MTEQKILHEHYGRRGRNDAAIILAMIENAKKFADWINKYQWEPAQAEEEGWQRMGAIDKGKILHQHSTTDALYELYSQSPGM